CFPSTSSTHLPAPTGGLTLSGAYQPFSKPPAFVLTRTVNWPLGSSAIRSVSPVLMLRSPLNRPEVGGCANGQGMTSVKPPFLDLLFGAITFSGQCAPLKG